MALIESLLKPSAYPHAVSNIELLETHISWVILTGEFAYKVKKPIVLSFLDFGTLERRKHFCEEELRLNCRWAPELYLDVVAITGSAEHPAVGGEGKVIEYALKMRQFPQEMRLDAQLDAGQLNESDMLELAEKVAGYHRRATKLAYVSGTDALERVAAPVRENFAYVRPHAQPERLQSIEDWSETTLRDLEQELVARHGAGHVRECHGDLHLANLVRLPSGIVAFDCVEFSAELRDIDTMSDVAFLAMDLAGRGRPDLCYLFTNRYLECSGDYEGMRVFGLYFVYHCMIRAKVAAIRYSERREDAGRAYDREELDHYCGIALKWINRPAPALVAMHGVSGSGKTWLSSQLMAHLPAIRVRSDIERQRLSRVNESADGRSGIGEGIYTDQARAEVYAILLGIASPLLEYGYNVILDASFLSQNSRDPVRALARSAGVTLVWVVTTASSEELYRRVENRTRSGSDASEADTSVLAHQLATADAMDIDERKQTISVATDERVDLQNLVRDIKQRLTAIARAK